MFVNIKMQNLSQNGLEQITKMQNLSQNDLEQLAEMRHIKNYKNLSKEGLLITLLKSGRSFAELYKNNFNDVKIEEIKKSVNGLRDRLSRSKITKIREKKLHKIENKENLSTLEEEKIKKYLTKLEKSPDKLKKYYNYDDLDYKGITGIKDLFNEITEVYYKPIKTNHSAFNNNYIEYESTGDKNKNLSIKQYLYMIILYLRDIINNHKAPLKLKVYLGNKIIDCKLSLVVNGKFS